MKVAIINRSDLRGGAAVFTYRLMNALRAMGIDASMLVCDRIGQDANVIDYASSVADRALFLAERLQIFCNNGFSRKNLFKVDTASWGRNISKHPMIVDADVIVLNWINQGALSLDCIEDLCRMGKPIVWTMHDMWQCTGICHHAYDCNRYVDACGSCMYLSSTRDNDLSRTVWKRKKALYGYKNLHFVAVSNWLAEKCRNSSLLAHKPIEVIPNTMPVADFTAQRGDNAHYGLPHDTTVLAMGAARLDDPVKGFDILIDVTRALRSQYPDQSQKFHLLLFGDLRDMSLLQQIAIPYTHLGRVDTGKVRHIMTHSDIVLSTSLYESFGGTLIEGQAAGCVPVTFGCGGQTDIVEHLHTGYIAEYKSSDDFAKGIVWATDAGIERTFLHNEVVQRFSPDVVGGKYITLFEQLLSQSHR